jgi:hypothetical protein
MLGLAFTLTACTQQGGFGGGGEGSDSTSGLKTGAGKPKNPDVSTNSGNLKGTVTPNGTVTSNTVDGSVK